MEVADTSLPYDVFGEPDKARARYGRELRAVEGAELVLPDGQAVRTSDLLPPA